MISSARLHLLMIVVWSLLLLPTLMWWRESVFWVVIMSWYAIVVGHWSSWEAARAEAKACEIKGETKQAVKEAVREASDDQQQ